MTTAETKQTEKRHTSYLPVVLTNLLALPLTALISINAAHEVTENGGFPDARYGQDGTNLQIAYWLFLLVAVPFAIASFIVLLKQKQLTRISAWCAGLGTLVLAPLFVFFALVLTGTDLG